MIFSYFVFQLLAPPHHNYAFPPNIEVLFIPFSSGMSKE